MRPLALLAAASLGGSISMAHAYDDTELAVRHAHEFLLADEGPGDGLLTTANARASLVSPPEGAATGESATFSWAPEDGVASYLLQASYDGCFLRDAGRVFTDETSATLTGLDTSRALFVSLYSGTGGGSFSSRDCVRYNADADGDGILNDLDDNPGVADPSVQRSAGEFSLSALPTGRVVELTVSQALYDKMSGGGNLSSELRAIAQALYGFYHDRFDFLFLTQYQSSSDAGYFGRYTSVRNDVSGIGVSSFDRSADYGADEARLQGVIHFPTSSSFSRGPGLHEIAHRWAMFLDEIPTTVGAHWGYSSGGGQLGGWAPGTLERDGEENGRPAWKANNGREGVTSFGTFANGGNGVPYNAIELYLMGMLPAEDLPTMQYAVNPEGLSPGRFTADRIETVLPAELVASAGERVPTFGGSQKAFSVLNVVLVTSPLSAVDRAEIDEAAHAFSRRGDDGRTGFNFHEATRGVGSLDMALGVSALRPVEDDDTGDGGGDGDGGGGDGGTGGGDGGTGGGDGGTGGGDGGTGGGDGGTGGGDGGTGGSDGGTSDDSCFFLPLEDGRIVPLCF